MRQTRKGSKRGETIMSGRSCHWCDSIRVYSYTRLLLLCTHVLLKLTRILTIFAYIVFIYAYIVGIFQSIIYAYKIGSKKLPSKQLVHNTFLKHCIISNITQIYCLLVLNLWYEPSFDLVLCLHTTE